MQTLPLKCPLSATRIKIPARFSNIPGFAAFDLDNIIEASLRSGSWKCPYRAAQSSPYNLRIDAFTQKILHLLQNYPDISEVLISPDAHKWKPSASDNWYDIFMDDPLPPHVSTRSDLHESEEEDEDDELREAAAQALSMNRKRKAAIKAAAFIKEICTRPNN